MKVKLVGYILGVMAFMLVACASQEKTIEDIEVEVQETEDVAISAGEAEIYEGMEWLYPWVDSDKTGVYEATGFDLVAPPEAVNVAYSYMPSTGMAQLNYTMENAMWIYRMKSTEALEDISGIYCEWNYTGETKVAGMEAMEYSFVSEPEDDFIDGMACTRVLNWYDSHNKVTYSLVVSGIDLNGMDTIVYAENLFQLTNNGTEILDAPESDGIAPVEDEIAKGFKETDSYKSFLGLHISDYDASEILVEEGGENDRLKVNVNLYRLCSLEDGVGIYENFVVSFHAKDPNGNLIRCCLYYNSDNSLCLEIEESTWEYLPTGTIISGFDN